MGELTGRKAIVTGANRGLGKAIVEKLAQNGCDVWAFIRKATPEYEEFVSTIANKYNVTIKTVFVDLCDSDSIKTAYKSVCADTTQIDYLINNAGIGHMGLFQMAKMDFIKDLYKVNLFAPMQLSQLVLRNMGKQKYGRIINVASTAASEVYEGNAIYGSSKAALVAFTQSFAPEAYKQGVTVNAIAPGLIDTDMSQIFEGSDPEEPIRHTALGRKIGPEEIADIVIELLLDKMNIINGTVITINGGHK